MNIYIYKKRETNCTVDYINDTIFFGGLEA
jgi:hypothetical protein